jgi:hypothetical protein
LINQYHPLQIASDPLIAETEPKLLLCGVWSIVYAKWLLLVRHEKMLHQQQHLSEWLH